MNSAGSTTRKKTVENKAVGSVVIPYISGLSESVQRVLRGYGITTAMKPYENIRKMVVHPKDKIEDSKKCECIYKIPCHNCSSVYIGETGREFSTRLKEHRKEVDDLSQRKVTRAERKWSQSEMNKSAVTDHAMYNNHVINWKDACVVASESDEKTRRIKEAVWIKKSGRVMNRDDGGYSLSRIWNNLTTPSSSGQH